VITYIQLTAKVRADTARMDRLKNPLAIADALADRILQRVRIEGDPTTRRSTTGNRRVARGSYWMAAGIARGYRIAFRRRSGKNSDQFKSKVYGPFPIDNPRALYYVDDPYRDVGRSPQTFAVTGGMWEGLRVTTSGEAARIRFRGSSAATGGKKVANEVKAMSIYRQTHVHVLGITEPEVRQVERAMDIATLEFAKSALDVEDIGEGRAAHWTGGESRTSGGVGTTALVRAILAKIQVAT